MGSSDHHWAARLLRPRSTHKNSCGRSNRKRRRASRGPGFDTSRLRGFERLEFRTMLAADVIINEFMYHPSSGDVGQEYIAIYNLSTRPAATATANLSITKTV